MFYYVLITLISLTIVLTSYFAPSALSFLGNETSQRFANTGLNLLRITLLIKPVFMILVKYTELRIITWIGLWDYLKTIKGRSWKGLRYMILSIIYFIAALGMRYRRLLGITTFLAIFTHAGIYIGGWIHMHFSFANQLQTKNILVGYLGALCLLIGYITSNNLAVRRLKGNRKTIQSVAYGALIFAVLHLLFLNFGEYFGQLILLVLYIILKLIEKKKINIF